MIACTPKKIRRLRCLQRQALFSHGVDFKIVLKSKAFHISVIVSFSHVRTCDVQSCSSLQTCRCSGFLYARLCQTCAVIILDRRRVSFQEWGGPGNLFSPTHPPKWREREWGSAGCAASLRLGCSRPQSHVMPKFRTLSGHPMHPLRKKRASTLLLLDAVTFVIFNFYSFPINLIYIHLSD